MRHFIVLMLILFSAQAFSQTKPLRILFDITSKDTLTHQAVLRHVKGMATAYPDALLEVVIYGGAWPMVVNGKTSGKSVVEKLAQQKNVSFKICSITMERFNVEKSQLITGVQVVPDGIIEIVTKQGEGWGYIKESHN
ncbi:MAG: DsrE family protein [Cyclobacteriaceae bacterium]